MAESGGLPSWVEAWVGKVVQVYVHGDSALVSTQGSVFGYVARKDDLGVGRPGFLPCVRNSFLLDHSSGRVVKLRLHPRVSALGSEPEP
jgi:hypothetical protein